MSILDICVSAHAVMVVVALVCACGNNKGKGNERGANGNTDLRILLAVTEFKTHNSKRGFSWNGLLVIIRGWTGGTGSTESYGGKDMCTQELSVEDHAIEIYHSKEFGLTEAHEQRWDFDAAHRLTKARSYAQWKWQLAHCEARLERAVREGKATRTQIGICYNYNDAQLWDMGW